MSKSLQNPLKGTGICQDLTDVLLSTLRRHPQNEDEKPTEGIHWDQYSVKTGSYNRRSEA